MTDYESTLLSGHAEDAKLAKLKKTYTAEMVTLNKMSSNSHKYEAGLKGTWEGPGRIPAVIDSLQFQWGVQLSSDFAPATNKMLKRAHTERYVDFVCQMAKDLDKIKQTDTRAMFLTPKLQAEFYTMGSDQQKVDCDTGFTKGSLPAAKRAAGAICAAIDLVMQKERMNAFCAVRPPGHHAGQDGLIEVDRGCGFCVFNNVMVGAMHCLHTYPKQVQKVAIIDFDVHHGNGTQDIITKYNQTHKHANTELMLFSSHLYDYDEGQDYEFYPATGEEDDLNHNCINAPLRPLWKQSLEEFEHQGVWGRHQFREVVVQRMLASVRVRCEGGDRGLSLYRRFFVSKSGFMEINMG